MKIKIHPFKDYNVIGFDRCTQETAITVKLNNT
jgi:hypothetical protein